MCYNILHQFYPNLPHTFVYFANIQNNFANALTSSISHPILQAFQDAEAFFDVFFGDDD